MLKFNHISVTGEAKRDLNEARMDSLVQVCYSESFPTLLSIFDPRDLPLFQSTWCSYFDQV